MIEGLARLIDDPAYVLALYGKLAARCALKNTAVVVEPRRVASWDHTKLVGTY